eukprot:TRINITY_DN10427_c0_g1_i9.p2 TRINITY_DN10427_c0_g1~~TRINITY_DN10427_c0_g1_i9.p2  ORF type:complete len:106 (+),score=11.75 TRINITY_DN10427_c0_g1_i9:293-610(+)
MQVYSLEDMISLTSCRRAFSASWVQAPQTFYSQCKGKLVLTTQQMQVYSLEDSDQLAELSQGVQREACADDRADTGERARGRDQLDELISLTSCRTAIHSHVGRR